MNSLIHKHCQRRHKSSRDSTGSKRGLVLNLCPLNLEMTSSVRYNLILTIANQIVQTRTSLGGNSAPSKVTGSKRVTSFVAPFWEIDTDMCGNIPQRIDQLPKEEMTPARCLERAWGLHAMETCRFQTKGARFSGSKTPEQVTDTVQDILINGYKEIRLDQFLCQVFLLAENILLLNYT